MHPQLQYIGSGVQPLAVEHSRQPIINPFSVTFNLNLVLKETVKQKFKSLILAAHLLDVQSYPLPVWVAWVSQ